MALARLFGLDPLRLGGRFHGLEAFVEGLARTLRELPAHISEDAVVAIASALKKAGVEFIAENGGGPGVRLRKSQLAKR